VYIQQTHGKISEKRRRVGRRKEEIPRQEGGKKRDLVKSW
jgi:hypothetical protein